VVSQSRAHDGALQKEDTVMIKRPSFPVAHAADPSLRRSFDHKLTILALVLAIIVAAALLVRAGPIAPTESDPDTFVLGP